MKNIFKIIIFLVILCFPLFDLSCLSAQSPKEIDSTKLSLMSRGEITDLIYYYASNDVPEKELLELSALLDNKQDTRALDDLLSKIKIRDVALACIAETTGESFLLPNRTYPTKAILLYKDDNHELRFIIPTIPDEEFKEMQSRINSWIRNKYE